MADEDSGPVRIRVPIDIEIEEDLGRESLGGEGSSPSGFQEGRPVSLPPRHHGHMRRPTYLPEGEPVISEGRPDAVRINDLKQLVIEILDEPEVRGRIMSGTNSFVSNKGLRRRPRARYPQARESGRFVEYGGASDPGITYEESDATPIEGGADPYEDPLGFQEWKINIRQDTIMAAAGAAPFAAMYDARMHYFMAIKNAEMEARNARARAFASVGSAPFTGPDAPERTTAPMRRSARDMRGALGASRNEEAQALAAFRAAQRLLEWESSAAATFGKVGSAPFEWHGVVDESTTPRRFHRGTDTGALGILGMSAYMRRQMEKDAELDQYRQLDALTGAMGTSVEKARMLQSFLQNPPGFMTSQLVSILGRGGPYGAALAAAIVAGISIPEIAKELIRFLALKGLPLNEDWNRQMETEQNGLWDIPEKKRRLLGIDAFNITQSDSYQPETGAMTYNSYENRHETIISRSVGLAEKAVGVVDL